MDSRIYQVLLIDDNAADLGLLRESWRECTAVTTHVSTLTDSREVGAYLRRTGPYVEAATPDLIMLDYRMPTDGGLALQVIKTDPDYLHIPVIVFTGVGDPNAMLEIYRQHANCCHRKPFELDDWIQMVQDIAAHWFRQSVLPPRSRSVAGKRNALPDFVQSWPSA